jgi:hypothetical protein
MMRKEATLKDDGSISLKVGDNLETTVEYRREYRGEKMVATVRWSALGEVTPARARTFMNALSEALIYAEALDAKEVSPALLAKQINKGKR